MTGDTRLQDVASVDQNTDAARSCREAVEQLQPHRVRKRSEERGVGREARVTWGGVAAISHIRFIEYVGTRAGSSRVTRPPTRFLVSDLRAR